MRENAGKRGGMLFVDHVSWQRLGGYRTELEREKNVRKICEEMRRNEGSTEEMLRKSPEIMLAQSAFFRQQWMLARGGGVFVPIQYKQKDNKP